jgi:hypothetical protein
MQIKLLGITDVYFDVIGHPDRIFYIHQILEKKWGYNGTVHQLLGPSQWPRGVGLRPLGSSDRGFESRSGHGCLSLVSICCPV